MKRVVSIVCSFALALSIGIASAGVDMKIAPGISIVPLAETDVAFTVPADMADYRHTYFVLVNDSERTIDSVSVIWRYRSIEKGEDFDAIKKTYEQYGIDKSQFHPVAAPHSRALLEPGSAGAHFFADAAGKRIGLAFDSMIFSDGEVIGPDSLHTAEELTARSQAAQEVSQAFHLGKLAGKAPIMIATELKPKTKPTTPAEFFKQRWTSTYADKVAQSTTQAPTMTDRHIRDLDSMTKPPKFWRSAPAPTNATKEAN